MHTGWSTEVASSSSANGTYAVSVMVHEQLKGGVKASHVTVCAISRTRPPKADNSKAEFPTGIGLLHSAAWSRKIIFWEVRRCE